MPTTSLGSPFPHRGALHTALASPSSPSSLRLSLLILPRPTAPQLFGLPLPKNSNSSSKKIILLRKNSYERCRREVGFACHAHASGNYAITTPLGVQGNSMKAPFKCISGGGEQQGEVAFKGDRDIINPNERTGSRVKVIGLGTRATGIVQFCQESALLSSAEFWIHKGDAVNLQSFELLNKPSVDVADGSLLDEVQSLPVDRVCDSSGAVYLVVGIGAGIWSDVALNILQSTRTHGGLSVIIVMQPFNFEGLRRKKEVEELAASLLEYTDMIFVVEHDALLRREKVTLAEALRLANNTVLLAIRAISDLVLGDQDKVFDAPLEGSREIYSSEILSILGHAGNAWVGFGSSYSVKAAVQRAAFESPFLQGLVPGVKGVVACTVASAEPKGKKDLRAALHALRCIIGPRAHLVCTTVKEPTLKQGVILVTILATRIDKRGSSEFSEQSGRFPELPFPFSLLGGGSNRSSKSMNGRELRNSYTGTPVQDMERNFTSKQVSKADVQEDKQHSPSDSLFEVKPSENNIKDVILDPAVGGSDTGQLSDSKYAKLEKFNVTDAADSSLDLLQGNRASQKLFHTNTEEKAAVEGNNVLREMSNCSQTDKAAGIDSHEDVATALNIPEVDRLSPTDAATQYSLSTEGTTSESGSKGGASVESEDNNESRSQGLRQQESGLDPSQDHSVMTGNRDNPTDEDNTLSDRSNSAFSKWRIPTLPSLLEWGKANMGVEKKSFIGWESGPNSAAAEAWAQARLEPGNFGALEKKESFKVPIGVRLTDEQQTESYMSGRQQVLRPTLGEPVNQALPFDPAVPLSRVVSSGLGAVVDIYNAASGKVLKKDGNEDGKQASSFLSQRAASMLETERSSRKLTPLVEMNYKNGVYKGRCRGGLPEGKGRLTYADGSFYDGLWKQGKRTGAGAFYYANGDVFQGYWRDDQMHGKGWFYFHTGDRLYADFWKGKANGDGRYFSAEGDVFFGQFRENWRHGESLFIEPSGIRWCETWDYGVLVSRTQLVDAEQT